MGAVSSLIFHDQIGFIIIMQLLSSPKPGVCD